MNVATELSEETAICAQRVVKHHWTMTDVVEKKRNTCSTDFVPKAYWRQNFIQEHRRSSRKAQDETREAQIFYEWANFYHRHMTEYDRCRGEKTRARRCDVVEASP
jgi:hypothetical protein